MEKEKFTSSQLDAVIKLLDKSTNKFYLYSMMIFVFFMVISLIPVSFLPKSSRLSDE